MRRLYLIIPGPDLAADLVHELLSDGMEQRQLSLFACRPRRLKVPVPVSRLSAGGGADSMLTRTLAGAVIALVIALVAIAVGGAGPFAGSVLLVATAVGAAIGAIAGRPRSGYPTELEPLREELDGDDVVMLLDVADQRLGDWEERIKDLHPEIRVKGTDPAGTPPFP